jgi:hypothetical protein
LITVLDHNLRVDDLKSFNRHITASYNQNEMGDDVELMVDDSLMDRKILETVLSKYVAQPQTPQKQIHAQTMQQQMHPAML